VRRFAGYVLVVVATLATLYLLWLLRAVAGVFVLSLFFAAAVRPIINRLKQRGLKPGLALGLTYAGIIAFVVLMVVMLSRPLSFEARFLVDALGRTYDTGYARWSVGSSFQQLVAARLPPPNVLYESLAAEEGRVLANALLTAGQAVSMVVAALVLVMVVSIYWTLDQAHFERAWLSLVKPDQRARARDIWRATEWGIGSYLRNEAAQAIIAFLLLWLGYSLMGIRYPTILAVVGSLAWLIPIVGFIFTMVPAFLGGWTAGLEVAIAAVIYTTIVLLLLEFVVQPRLFRRRLYSPILVILMLVPLAESFGILGLLAAPPLAVMLQTLLGSLLQRRSQQVSAVYPTSEVEALRNRLSDVRIAAKLEEAPELSNMAQRLERLLQESQQVLRDEPVPNR
jgi:putative permease